MPSADCVEPIAPSFGNGDRHEHAERPRGHRAEVAQRRGDRAIADLARREPARFEVPVFDRAIDAGDSASPRGTLIRSLRRRRFRSRAGPNVDQHSRIASNSAPGPSDECVAHRGGPTVRQARRALDIALVDDRSSNCRGARQPRRRVSCHVPPRRTAVRHALGGASVNPRRDRARRRTDRRVARAAFRRFHSARRRSRRSRAPAFPPRSPVAGRRRDETTVGDPLRSTAAPTSARARSSAASKRDASTSSARWTRRADANSAACGVRARRAVRAAAARSASAPLEERERVGVEQRTGPRPPAQHAIEHVPGSRRRDRGPAR